MKLREKNQLTLLLFLIVHVVKAKSDVSAVQVGRDAVLGCDLSIENFSLITWKVESPHQPSCYLSALRHDSRGNCSHRIHLTIDKNKTYLRIDNVAILDDGNYTCEVASRLGTFMSTVVLQVLAEPLVLLETDTNGHPVCRAIGGRPAANISWAPEPTSEVMTRINLEKNGTATVISSYNATDMTNVTCVVSHPSFERPVHVRPAALTMGAGAGQLFLIVGLLSVLLLLLGIVLFWKRSNLRTCLSLKQKDGAAPEDPTSTDVDDVEPYASFTVKVNSIYDVASDIADCKEENKARWNS
ncbi:cell surface glycoprotein CD200 receptor 2-like [Leptodactylus fuscus]|uniref:cell surface glycoprotein CD200 receptor 2-like n=1 Tax=Leptodactylus fuscus TaxID=238119 RepID=UPI003F4EDC44